MATVKVCDICNSQKDINLREYEIGTQPDAAGGPSESIVKSYDLCQSCEVIILNNTIKSIIKESGYNINNILPLDTFIINKQIVSKITDLILNNKKFLN
jgi:hypothetical protein